LVREGLTRILCAADFHILDSVTCVDDADMSSQAPQSSVLLIIDSGDASDEAVEQVERIKKQHAATRIAMLADCYRVDHVMHAFEAGTDAYFVRVANWDAFIKSLELVMLGETILPSALLPFILNHDTCSRRAGDPAGHDLRENLVWQATDSDATPPLSAREQCILRYLIEGHSNKAIARKVDIAEATVKVHVKTILRKIRVQNRTQAAIWAVSNGSFNTSDGWSGPTAAAHQPPYRNSV
jgi:two-component system nitrate/nitrite response regulator NarL